LGYAEVVRKTAAVLSKAGAPHVVVGALAAGCHGLPRPTRDVDVMVVANPGEMRRLTELVLAAGFEKVKSARQPALEEKLVVESGEGYRVNISQTKTEHDVEAVKRSKKISVFGVDIWVVSPENLILQKLVLGRPGDINDAVAVLIRQKRKLDVEYLNGWASNLKVSDELRELMEKVE